jgi:hypothetical protein
MQIRQNKSIFGSLDSFLLHVLSFEMAHSRAAEMHDLNHGAEGLLNAPLYFGTASLWRSFKRANQSSPLTVTGATACLLFTNIDPSFPL